MLILLVDDYPASRRLMRDVLEAPGTHFIEAADGEDAVTAFDTHHPDWVIMDINMPRMDGIAATRAIRQSHSWARIIVTTAYDSIAFRRAADEAGAEAYIAKDELHRVRELFPIISADLNEPQSPGI